MKSAPYGVSTAPTKKAKSDPDPLKIKRLDGFKLIENGNLGFPDPGIEDKLAAFYKKYPRRKLRKGEKGAAQLVKEERGA